MLKRDTVRRVSNFARCAEVAGDWARQSLEFVASIIRMAHIKGLVEGESRRVENLMHCFCAFLLEIFGYKGLALRIEIITRPYRQYLVIGVIFGHKAWKVQGRPSASQEDQSHTNQLYHRHFSNFPF